MLFLSVFQKATLVQNLTQLRMSHFYSDLLNPCLGNPCEHAGTCHYEDCVMMCDCAPYRTGPLCDEGNNRSNENNNSRVTPLSVYCVYSQMSPGLFQHRNYIKYTDITLKCAFAKHYKCASFTHDAAMQGVLTENTPPIHRYRVHFPWPSQCCVGLVDLAHILLEFCLHIQQRKSNPSCLDNSAVSWFLNGAHSCLESLTQNCISI